MLWVIAAVALAVGEVLTMSFFLAPFAAGALIAAGVDALGAGAGLSWVAFIVSSLGALTLVRPIARSHLRTPPQIRTGTAALVGRVAVVTELVGHNSGTVKLEGELWSARPLDDDQVFEAGARVQVVEIRGAIAVVTD